MSINLISAGLSGTAASSPLTADGDFGGDESGGAQTLGAGPSFGQTLQSAFNNVNSLQNNAASAAKAFALGQAPDIHSVMIAGQKASVALELTTEVRNKIIDAYQTIMSISM